MAANGGYIKLWRKMLDSPIMQSDGLCRLWIYCLLQADWRPSRALAPRTMSEINVPRGSFMTWQTRLHEALYPTAEADKRELPAPSARTVWRWLKALEAMGCVKLESVSSRFTMVSVCKYETYQSAETDMCHAGVTQVSRRCHAGVTQDETTLVYEEDKNGRMEEGPPEPTPDNLSEIVANLRFQWLGKLARPPNAQESNQAIETAFLDLILEKGVTAEAIRDAIKNKRRNGQLLWDFCKALVPKKGADLLAGLAAFVAKGDDE